MMLCYRRLVDDDQTAQLRIFVSRGPLCHPERRLPRSTSLRAGSVEGSTRSDLLTPPEQSPILSFSACLAENPGSFPALLHASLKFCHCGFIDSINAIFFCALKKRIGILRAARGE